MTACLSQPRPTLALTPATRGNLLALNPAGPVCPIGQSLQRLRHLGYRVTEIQPDHWLLQAAQSPGKIHLYGAAELADFTRGRACAYSIRAASDVAVTQPIPTP